MLGKTLGARQEKLKVETVEIKTASTGEKIKEKKLHLEVKQTLKDPLQSVIVFPYLCIQIFSRRAPKVIFSVLFLYVHKFYV